MREIPQELDFSEAPSATDEEPGISHLNAQTLIEAAVQTCGEEYRKLIADIRRYKGHVAGICSGSSNEEGRRRLRNPQFKTTYPRDNINSLNALSLKYRNELAKQLPRVLELALKLEEVELHLVEAWRREQETLAEKKHWKETGLFPAVAAAADALFRKHGVKHWHWSAADDDRLDRIAAILSERIEEPGR